MPEPVTIPISFIEVTFQYTQPNIGLWGDRSHIAQTLFDALHPWQPNIDDIEPLSAGKISEQGLIIKLPLKRITLFFGPAFCRFSRDSTDWSLVEETIAIFDAATSAFAEIGGVTIGLKKTAMGLHLQLQTVHFVRLLEPFISPRLCALEGSPLQVVAVVAKWDGRRITLDGSASIANGIFLKSERDFDGATPSAEIGAQLLRDEQQLLALLGVEEDR